MPGIARSEDVGDLATRVADEINAVRTELADKPNAIVSLTTPSTDVWADITIVDDGSSTASWVDRFRISFDPVTGSTRPTFWLNEYGEARGMPAKDNTVGYRIFAALDASGYTARNADTEVLEVTNQRDGTRTTMFGVRKGGRLRSMGHDVGIVYTLEAAEDEADIPADLPIGTLIVRKL